MIVVVLAGDDGRRLRPLTADTPKALLPLCGRPLLSFTEEWLRREGVTQAYLMTGVFADALRTFADRPGRQVNWRVLTGGLPRFDGEEVLVIAGNVLLNEETLDLSEMLCIHRRGCAATAAIVQNAAGTAAVTADGMLNSVDCPSGFSIWRVGGVALFSAQATASLIVGEQPDVRTLLARLIREGQPVGTVPTDLPLIDTPEDYRMAIRRIGAPFIAPTVRRGIGAQVDEHSDVEAGAVIGAGAHITGCIIGSGVHIGDGAVLRDCVVGDRAEIGESVRLGTDCVIGRGARIAAGVTLSPGVRVWAGQTVAGDCLRAAPLRWREDTVPVTATPLYEWTAARLAAVGTAIGSEWNMANVLVGAENATAAMRIGALTAGLCETGCAVRCGGESFLAEMAYLTAALPVKYGVFLAEDGLHLLGEDGRDLPRTVRQAVERRLTEEDVICRAPYEWQPVQHSVWRGLYRDRLFQEAATIRPVALELRGNTAACQRLWEILEQVRCTRGGDLRLRLSDGGRRLAVYTPQTGYLDADRVEELLRWVDGDTPLRSDGLTAALHLLRSLSTGETLEALNARLPAAVTVYRTAEITPETITALQSMSGDYLDSEGVRVARPDGVVTVRPAARGRLLSVLARAQRTEIAEELCAGMLTQLHAVPIDNM